MSPTRSPLSYPGGAQLNQETGGPSVAVQLSLYPETISEPFPKRQILDASKLKEFADDNFKFDENVRMFSKRIENTVETGEIARNE